MWSLLGLDPTTDKTLIRRAYFTRLKAIDVDAEPRRFMALREAFEQALEWADEPTAEEFGTEDELWDEALPEPERPVRQGASQAEADAGLRPDEVLLFLDFQNAEDECDGRRAEAIFNKIMARGLIEIGLETEVASRLLETAAKDPSFAADDLRALAGRLCLAEEEVEGLKAAYEAREWLVQLETCAGQARVRGRPARQARRLARLLLKHPRRPGMFALSSVELWKGLEEYSLHSAWLGSRIDQDWTASLRRKLKARDLFYTILFILFLGFMGLNLLFQVGRSLITGKWD